MQQPVGLRVLQKKRVSFPLPLLDLLTCLLSFGKPLCNSKTEARRLVRSRAVHVNRMLQKDEMSSVSTELDRVVVKVGKKAAWFQPDHFLYLDICEWITEESAKNAGYYPMENVGG